MNLNQIRHTIGTEAKLELVPISEQETKLQVTYKYRLWILTVPNGITDTDFEFLLQKAMLTLVRQDIRSEQKKHAPYKPFR